MLLVKVVDSPSHGTAFDIAWQGKAKGDGMLEAVRMAAGLAAKKTNLEGTLAPPCTADS